MKSRSLTRVETTVKETFVYTRSSEALANTLKARLEVPCLKLTSEQKKNLLEKLYVIEDQIDTKQTQKDEETFYGELFQLFSKKYKKKQKAGNQNCSSNEDKTPEKKSRRGARDSERKLKKKINFHVLVKSSKLYHALKFTEQQIKIQNQREILRNDAEESSKGPLSAY